MKIGTNTPGRHRRGSSTAEYILILAAIILPLLAIVIWFHKNIWEFLKGLKSP